MTGALISSRIEVVGGVVGRLGGRGEDEAGVGNWPRSSFGMVNKVCQKCFGVSTCREFVKEKRAQKSPLERG